MDGRVSGRALGFTALASVWLVLVAGLAVAPLGHLGGPVVSLVALAGPSLALARRHGDVRRVLGLGRPPAVALLGAALLGASLWLLVLVAIGPLVELMPDREQTDQRLAVLIDPALGLPLRLVLFAAVPAVCEELLCRGVLCRHLAVRFGPTIGIALSSLFFAALHLSLAQGIPVLVLGVALGLVTLRTGSTWCAIVGHFMNNCAVILTTAPELSIAARVERDGVPLGAVGISLTVAMVGISLIRGATSRSESLR